MKLHICKYIKLRTLTKLLQVQLNRHNVFVAGKKLRQSIQTDYKKNSYYFSPIFFKYLNMSDQEYHGKHLNNENTYLLLITDDEILLWYFRRLYFLGRKEVKKNLFP